MGRMGLSGVFLLIASFAYATTLKISWDSDPGENIAGYCVYWGHASKTYTDFVNLGKVHSYEIADVQGGKTYFCTVTAIDFWGNESTPATEVSTVIGEEEPSPPELPIAWELQAGYPNPFRQGELSYFELALPEAASFNLAVYNVLGQKVRTLHEGEKSAGRYLFSWDGRDESQNLLPSAVYFYRLQSGFRYLTKSISMIH